MKKLILMLSALLALPFTWAGPNSDALAQSATGRQIQLPGQIYKMQPEEIRSYMQGYTLSNGEVLSLYSRGKRMYAKVEDQLPHEIVAIAPNTFVALDQTLQFTIQLLPDETARGELLMASSSERTANRDATTDKIRAVELR